MITLGSWLAVIEPMASWKGRGFPDESELNYSEGTLKVEVRKSRKTFDAYFIVVVPKNSLRGVTYYCNYAAYHNPFYGWCMREEIKPYINQ